MKIFISLLLLLHAILHLMGLVKSFYDDFLPALSRKIGKPEGILWLLCAILLFIADLYFLMGSGYWPVLAIIGALLSQFLITLNWEDAKYGSVINIVILAVSFPALV
ncbi:hypothetical protein [Salinimicrobium xinjiangense]|uniref:hypothetical protein n=1 Tax=Salinimicrobium xinjiangense TaxID=438596 RepID=UPI00048D4B91|nr:hypothetical protein [Salinimicrobium xinjiangense]